MLLAATQAKSVRRVIKVRIGVSEAFGLRKVA
jgi:hypothetical protein